PCQGWGRGFESHRPLQISQGNQHLKKLPSGGLLLTMMCESVLSAVCKQKKVWIRIEPRELDGFRRAQSDLSAENSHHSEPALPASQFSAKPRGEGRSDSAHHCRLPPQC